MRRASHIAAVLAACVLVASLAVAARNPIGFKTIAALTEAPLPALESREAIDIASIVRAIPDRGPAGSARFARRTVCPPPSRKPSSGNR